MTTTVEGPELPSLHQLWRATALAVLVALVLLVVVILPAEYGIDPTGVGRRMSIFRPRAVGADRAPATDEGAASTQPGAAGAALVRSNVGLRTDEMSIVLQAGEGAEIKAVTAQGHHFVYSWEATGGAVDVDMHGEAFDAPEDEFTSYWKEDEQTADRGAFVAPVGGRHGWFWQNLNDTPVTVVLRTSGFYEKLIRP
jgi:hypothetical protein